MNLHIKKNIRGIFAQVLRFSEKDVLSNTRKRFSEQGEVKNYGRTFNVRGDILTRQFIKNKKSNILEVGCASGSIAFTLVKHGHHVDGIDFSKQMIHNANEIKRRMKVRNVSFRHLDVLDLKVKEKYDYVLALFNLLTYFPKKECRIIALENMLRALKPGGLMIVDMTNKYGSWRIFAKELSFKALFLLSGKNRPFGDVYSNPMFLDSREVLFQHYLSKREMISYLKKFSDIRYEIKDYSIFSGESTKRDFVLIIRKLGER